MPSQSSSSLAPPCFCVDSGVSSVSADNRHLSGIGWYVPSTTNYYHEDHLGTSRLMTGWAGWPVWQGTFLPYGQDWNAQATTQHYKFTGDEHDTESNTEHTQFRQLATTQGRWLSPDPWLGSIDLTNPQTFNRYGYVANNPLNATDPDGLNLVKIQAPGMPGEQVGCGLAPEYQFPCPDGAWDGTILLAGAIWQGASGGGGGVSAPTSTPANNPGGQPPLSGETLGIPNSVHIRIPGILQSLGVVPYDAPCDFVACSAGIGNSFGGTDQLGAGLHVCGDFVCDAAGKLIGILPPAARGLDEDQWFEFALVGAIMRPPTIWAGRYNSGGGGFNIKNFPFGGNRIGLHYHEWADSAGRALLHLDVKIQQFGINLRHWPW